MATCINENVSECCFGREEMVELVETGLNIVNGKVACEFEFVELARARRVTDSFGRTRFGLPLLAKSLIERTCQRDAGENP